MPHRDLPYEECHTQDGHSSILSVLVPLGDASLNNGCMYCIPRENDPLFHKCGPGYTQADRDAHVTPFRSDIFPYQAVQPLVAKSGTPLVWHPNTIHWGSSCSPYLGENEVPRKSIAMAFRLPSEELTYTEKEHSLHGRVPFTRQEIRNELSLEQRLALCAKGILMYSVWFPEFNGLDSKQFQQKLLLKSHLQMYR